MKSEDLPPDYTKADMKSVAPERKVNAGVAVVIFDVNNRILMGKRRGSHGAGTWSFPGGWMRHGESFQQTAEREVQEETGLFITGEVGVIDATTTFFKDRDLQSVTILLTAPFYQGTPKAMEPEKLEGEWEWFDLNALPEPLFEPLLAHDTVFKRIERYCRELSAFRRIDQDAPLS